MKSELSWRAEAANVVAWYCRLENTALLLADELSAHQALAIAEALEEIQSRNLSLLNK